MPFQFPIYSSIFQHPGGIQSLALERRGSQTKGQRISVPIRPLGPIFRHSPPVGCCYNRFGEGATMAADVQQQVPKPQAPSISDIPQVSTEELHTHDHQELMEEIDVCSGNLRITQSPLETKGSTLEAPRPSRES